MAASTSINSYFRSRINQFHSNTLQRLWRSNPFRSLVPTREYNGADGENPTIIQYTHELPTSYPVNVATHTSGTMGMETVKVSPYPDPSGETVPGGSAPSTDPTEGGAPGNPRENPTSPQTDTGTNIGPGVDGPSSHTIKRGQTERTFEIRQTSFKTDTVCLTDIKRSWQAAEAVGAFEKAMREFINVFYGDYYRVQNIGMVGSKYTPDGAGAGTWSDDNLNQDFTGVTAPTAQLGWNDLNAIYFELVRRGIAEEMAIGTANGRPVLPLIASPECIQRLWKENASSGVSIAEQVKFFDPKSNLALLGYDGAINGFLPIVDIFPIRTDQQANGDGLTTESFIYPTTNADASFGRKYTKNTAYDTAEYEVATILPPKVYECVYEPSTPTAFAGMNFDPQNYVGEFRWINNQTFEGHNDRGNLGYYMADIRIGCKPVNPDLGVSILSLKG